MFYFFVIKVSPDAIIYCLYHLTINCTIGRYRTRNQALILGPAKEDSVFDLPKVDNRSTMANPLVKWMKLSGICGSNPMRSILLRPTKL